MEIVLFTYDRPHWKTERFLHELVSLGHKPCLVIASPWRRLPVPPAMVMTVKHTPRHPEMWARRYGIDYLVEDHDRLPGDRVYDLGVIGGARMITQATIDRFETGILNVHPGMIPMNRGLSNVCRAIRDGLPQAVTAHLIDERVDAGRLLAIEGVRVEADDSVYDVGEKMMDAQVELLGHAIRVAERASSIPLLAQDCGGYQKPLTMADEEAIMAQWCQR